MEVQNTVMETRWIWPMNMESPPLFHNIIAKKKIKNNKVPSIWPVQVLLVRVSADHNYICSATYNRDTWV